MPTFINRYLEHTKNYESPNSFWLWSAFTAISAVLRDNVYVTDGDSRLYPNIYVLFLAGSAARKGRPVNLAEEIVKMVGNTKVISGRASIQAIMDELGQSELNQRNARVIKPGSAIFFAPELSAGLVEDKAATGILTDIYDGKTDFKNILRHSPKFKIDRIVFSAFMASNEALIKSVFDIRANQGGLLGRTFVIVPDEFRPSNSLMRGVKTDDIKKDIASELTKISELKEPFQFSEEAILEYEKWYIPFREGFRRKKDPGGVAGRIHTSIKKLAMILSADELEIVIRKRHIERAIFESVSLLPNYNSLIMASGKSSLAEAGTTIIQDLYQAVGRKIKRSTLLANHAFDFDMETMDKVMETYQAAGFVTFGIEGTEVIYILTDKGKETFES